MKSILSIYAGTIPRDSSDTELELNFTIDLVNEAGTAPYREALTLVKKAMVSNYMEPENRAVLRKLIHPETWKEREFDDRLCRRYRLDPDLGLETWLRGVEVRFEALLELKNLLELTMMIVENEAQSASQARAEEERKQRLERDLLALKAWWRSLTKQERDNGLRGVLLRLDLSRKEMDEYWKDKDTDIETQIQLMAMAMYALETKTRERAKDIRTRQEPKFMKKEHGRRGHLRLVLEAA